jgi:hypothetical protein
MAIIGLYKTSIEVYDYLKDVKSAPSDRKKYMMEASTLSIMLLDLQDLLEPPVSEGPWLSSVQRLTLADGPFDHLRNALGEIAKTLTATGLGKLGQLVVWTRIKTDIAKQFSTIERIKSTISMILSQHNS